MLDESFNRNLTYHKHYHSSMLRISGKPGKSGLAFVFGVDERQGVNEMMGGNDMICIMMTAQELKKYVDAGKLPLALRVKP